MYKIGLLTFGLCFNQFASAENTTTITTGSRFNPQISLILDGNFYHDNQKGKSGEILDGAAKKKQDYKTAII